MTRSSARRFIASLLLLGGCFGARPATTLEVGRGPALAWTPSGEFVATSGDGVRVWLVRDKDTGALLEEGRLVANLQGPSRLNVTALAFPRQRLGEGIYRIAGTVQDGSRENQRIFVWWIPTREIERRLVFPRGRSETNAALAYTSSTALVALVSGTASTGSTALAVYPEEPARPLVRPLEPPSWAAESNPRRAANLETAGVFRAEFSPDAAVVAVGRQDRDAPIDLYAVGSGHLLHRLERSARCDALALSDELVAGAIAHDTVRLWSRKDGSAIADLVGGWPPGEDRIWALAVSPAGDLVAAGGYGGKIHIWSVADKRLASTLGGHAGVVCALQFSPRGDALASAGWDGNVKIWAVAREGAGGAAPSPTDTR